MKNILVERLTMKLIDNKFPYLEDKQERVKRYYDTPLIKEKIDMEVLQIVSAVQEIESVGFELKRQDYAF